MAKFQLLLAFLFVTIVTISAMAIDDSQAGSQEGSNVNQSDEYWPCENPDKIACSASCTFHGHWKGGYCNEDRVCICN